MRTLIKNLELISGKKLSLSDVSQINADKYLPLIPKRESYYEAHLKNGYFIAANFKKGTGPVVLNRHLKNLIDSIDGKSTVREIMQKNNKQITFKEAVYFLSNYSMNIRDIYDNFFLSKVLVEEKNISLLFRTLEFLGLVYFKDLQEKEINWKKDYLECWIHLTGECNLACDYCYVRKKKEKMTPETGIKIIDKIFATAQKNKLEKVHIKFGGGEPLIHFDLIISLTDYAQKVFSKSGTTISFYIASNGTLLNEKIIDEIKKRKITIGLSLDGTEKWHNLHAKYEGGKGSFLEVEKGIDLLISKGIRPGVISVISADNLSGALDLVKYLGRKRISAIFNFIRKGSDMQNEMLPENNAMTDKIFEILEYFRVNLPRSYQTVSNFCNRVPSFYFPDRFWCGVGDYYIIIEPSGDIVPCVMSLGNEKEIIGNIDTTDDLLSLIRRPEIQNKNPLHSQKKECFSCEYLGACSGGCPSDNFYSNGSYSSASRYCEVYKKIIPKAMEVIGLVLLKHY